MSPKSQNPKNNIYLIDGSGFIFRAYYALPPLTRSDGLPVGAVSGFCNMIYKLLTSKLNDAILMAGGPIFAKSSLGNVRLIRTNSNGTVTFKKYKINFSS